MKTITACREINAPIGKVFDAISKQSYFESVIALKFPEAVHSIRKISDPYGAGTIPQIDFKPGLIWFLREITYFEPPSRIDYQIQDCHPILRHRGSSIRLFITDAGTYVQWKSNIQTHAYVPRLGLKYTNMLSATIRKISLDFQLMRLAKQLEQKTRTDDQNSLSFFTLATCKGPLGTK